jgi:hypothetical protein
MGVNIPTLLLACLLIALPTRALPIGVLAQDATAPGPTLPDGAVAALDGEAITEAAFLTYLGAAYARHPMGQSALEQLFVEALLTARASEAGLRVDDDLVQALFDRFDAQAREASGGARGLLDNAGGAAAADMLDATLRLAALQRTLVAQEQGLDDPLAVDDQTLSDWLATELTEAKLQEHKISDALAASWSGGDIPRATVGLRLLSMLPTTEQSSVLSELLGIVAISRYAASRGIAYDNGAAVAELTERERLVDATPATAEFTYEEYLLQTEGLTVEELLSTPKFRAEVLMVQIVDSDWDAARLASLFEELRAPLAERFGPDVTLDMALPTLLKEARQRAYREILDSVTIVRRF